MRVWHTPLKSWTDPKHEARNIYISSLGLIQSTSAICILLHMPSVGLIQGEY